ncbi:DNA gyrase inhibitor YacG [Psychrobium sp. 1_MG-2023]|uniref:DNA gyrase inhibitor YacG n=1 Tax=Psychrobium sp. 1_MG-2023 TaxID=3062624 RepID=UPI000C33EA38|nr:DNA gyrase inhibitor YacG [Psychrobium sp. 1_MG-2023]MDP2562031.1 DNA gyrase inhibitor YacG [Psychrobium sp. 1_MG-2023]PKF58518.1 DNA gyrase inhibitor YacG [Alteromonadales bacterium alter-6D02]
MTEVNCPTCDKTVLWIKESTFRPFCSERCKLIDLGEWASENNTIAGPSLNNELAIDEFDLPLNDEFFQPDE